MEFALAATGNFIRRLSDDTNGDDDNNGSHYEGPLTGIVFAVMVGLTLLFVIIDCTRVLSSLSKYLCGRERSNRLSTMDDETYKQFLLKHERYAGIAADYFPNGAWFMKPGAFEDFLRYMANEHHLLGLVLADRLHPFSRIERATAFLIMHSFIFFLTAVASSTNDKSSYFILSIVVISPVRVIIDKLLYLLLAVPCSRSCCPCCRSFLNGAGHAITFLLLLVGLLLCWLSAYLVSSNFPTATQQRLIIWNYLYTVFIVSAAQELFLIYLNFVDIEHCCCFNLMNSLTCGFLKIGIWSKEAVSPQSEVASKSVGDIEAPGAGAPLFMQQPPSGANHTAPVSPTTPVIVAYGHTVEMTSQQVGEHRVIVAPDAVGPSPTMVVSGYAVAPTTSL